MRSEHKAIAKKPKSKKKQDEMQEKIAKTERDKKEMLERGKTASSFKEMMDKSDKQSSKNSLVQIPRR